MSERIGDNKPSVVSLRILGRGILFLLGEDGPHEAVRAACPGTAGILNVNARVVEGADVAHFSRLASRVSRTALGLPLTGVHQHPAAAASGSRHPRRGLCDDRGRSIRHLAIRPLHCLRRQFHPRRSQRWPRLPHRADRGSRHDGIEPDGQRVAHTQRCVAGGPVQSAETGGSKWVIPANYVGGHGIGMPERPRATGPIEREDACRNPCATGRFRRADIRRTS